MSNEYYKNHEKYIEQEKAIAFIHGRISVQIEDFAKILKLPERELANRLGILLLGLQSGEKIRVENNLPELRPKTTKRTKRLRKMEMVSSTHRNKTYKKNSSITRRGQKSKSWWMKFTPEQRKKIMAERRKKGGFKS